MDVECLTSRSDLEAIVGSQPLASMLKTIAAFDRHCDALLAAAPLAVLGTTDVDGARRSVVFGGSAGFAHAPDPTQLTFTLPAGLRPAAGAGAGLLFLIPGLGETLRVNGRVRADGSGIDVEEAYVHCAKAVIRSELWSGPAAGTGAPPATEVSGAGPLADAEVRELLARGRFGVITSCDAEGAADASPKGDPAGFVQVLDASTLAFPDRPGNRRTDTFHNLVDDPAVGIVLVAPGDVRVLEVQGRARLTADADLRASMAARDRVPKLAVVVDVERATVTRSAALADSGIWDPATHLDPATLPKMTQVWADHVKLNRTPGLAAKAIRTAVSGKVLERGIASDYQRNLY